MATPDATDETTLIALDGLPWHSASRVELSPSAVVLSGIKLPEDGAPDELVVRVYEATGRAVKAELRVMGATQAWQSDVRESRGAPSDCRDGTIAFDIGAFEIIELP